MDRHFSGHIKVEKDHEGTDGHLAARFPGIMGAKTVPLEENPRVSRLRELQSPECDLSACALIKGSREIRSFGLRNPIAVIPNGISDTWLMGKGDGNSFRRRHGIPDSAWMIFFLGRITPKKGLSMLLRAMAHLQRDTREIILVIGGDRRIRSQARIDLAHPAVGDRGTCPFRGAPLWPREIRQPRRRGSVCPAFFE